MNQTTELQNPQTLMTLPRFSLRRLSRWTVPNRYFRIYSKLMFRPFEKLVVSSECRHFFNDRGSSIPDTAVTSRQLELLLKAVDETEKFNEPIVEVGSYRGATTRAMASRTKRMVCAVDPFVGWGGSERDFATFRQSISSLSNVKHYRKSSGEAAREFGAQPISLVFIDAVHDFINTRYDFEVWGKLLRPGGLAAFHDVDDWPGTNVACQQILQRRNDFRLWGYCPNMLILERKG